LQGYDVIGDVHGCATQLMELLDAMGYRKEKATGAYCHPYRQAVFVGDLIDRGTEQLQTLSVVKSMVESGSAQIVMGNHEFNAIAYATERPGGGGFLRERNEKNLGQHQAFLDQVTGAQRDDYLDWFKTLPLWLDLGDLRIVHACWHEDSMRTVVQQLGSSRFNTLDQFVKASTKGDPLFEAVDILLKGPEISLISYGQPAYCDKDGHQRKQARLRWWNEKATTLREIAEMGDDFRTDGGDVYPPLPDAEVPAGERSFVYTGKVPVVYGHYWRRGTPKYLLDWTAHTACVDFSAVKGGRLTAYRWSGEHEVRPDSYWPRTKGVVGLSI
jgi:hypothetical protein